MAITGITLGGAQLVLVVLFGLATPPILRAKKAADRAAVLRFVSQDELQRAARRE